MPSEIVTKDNRVLDSVTQSTEKKSKHTMMHYPYTLVGKIEEVYNNGLAKVSFVIETKSYSYEAISTQPLRETHVAKECVIAFNQGDISKPIITGMIQTQKSEPLVISSEEGIILECGDTRIELDVDGTLDLKALHINSQAYGPYRIKGGSVKIN
jgi:hypothetical protein